MKAVAGAAASVLARTGLLDWLERSDHDHDRVRIIAYHRVDDLEAEPDLDPGLVSATPADFRSQVELIARHYHPIGLAELVAAQKGEATLPERAVLLTFDDGYRDFAEQAWPILRAAGVPAVLFVPTAFPDVAGPGFWWDRLHAALRRTPRPVVEDPAIGSLPLGDATDRRAAHRAIRAHVKARPHDEAMAWLDALLADLADLPSLHRVLGWDDLRALARDGLAVCSHGHRHALMTRLDPDARAEDLVRSRRLIDERLGEYAPPPVFAYPASAQDAASREAVREAGYALAFGGDRRIAQVPAEDPWHVPRLPMMKYDTALFRAQLRPGIARLGRLLIDRRIGAAA